MEDAVGMDGTVGGRRVGNLGGILSGSICDQMERVWMGEVKEEPSARRYLISVIMKGRQCRVDARRWKHRLAECLRAKWSLVLKWTLHVFEKNAQSR